jgi:maltose alpha-D-glucosyltransferase/alpha-amylase
MSPEKIRECWRDLYRDQELPKDFIKKLCSSQEKAQALGEPNPEGWYKDEVVYCLYVDKFNRDFKGLKDKLAYLKELGVTCLWLLPILDSPMKDDGFDIKDYRKIRPALGTISEFSAFIKQAYDSNIRVIFDIAINHTSDEHEWFKSSSRDPNHDYYIWSKTGREYKKARIIFPDVENSNWESVETQDGEKYYYFHRFYKEQPDLNYRNPKVLLAMCENLVYWVTQGVDGFRLDAVPFLWKEENTECESLPEVHKIVKFFRAVLDFVRPNTLLLAEAAQKPEQVVDYFGDGDECHAAYHFPLMPNIYLALAQEDNTPIVATLLSMPDIPKSCQWFTFVRCHDELTLEMLEPPERKVIYDHYCHDLDWSFRKGQGISARLADLFQGDVERIYLINSILLTLIGTPIIYYGDEIAMQNDVEYREKQEAATAHNDSRYLVRGPFKWEVLDENSVFEHLKKMLEIRQTEVRYFGQGEAQWIPVNKPDGQPNNQVLAYLRFDRKDDGILVLNNLSANPQTVVKPYDLTSLKEEDFLLRQNIDYQKQEIVLNSHGYCWLKINVSKKSYFLKK